MKEEHSANEAPGQPEKPIIQCFEERFLGQKTLPVLYRVASTSDAREAWLVEMETDELVARGETLVKTGKKVPDVRMAGRDEVTRIMRRVACDMNLELADSPRVFKSFAAELLDRISEEGVAVAGAMGLCGYRHGLCTPVGAEKWGEGEVVCNALPWYNPLRPVFTEPGEPGEHGKCDRILAAMFPDEYVRDLVMAWLWEAYDMARGGGWRTLPALALLGDVNTGKSFFQSLADQLTGRYGLARINRWVNGESRFNGDLVDHFLWTLDDPAADSWRRADRVGAGKKLKGIIAAEAMDIEGKGKTIAQGLRLRRAVIISANDDEDSIRCLPLLHEADMRDKAVILRCAGFDTLGIEAYGGELQSAIQNAIGPELPSFLGSCRLASRRVAAANGGTGRCTVPGYVDPEVLDVLSDADPKLEIVNAIHWVLDQVDKGDRPGLGREEGKEVMSRELYDLLLAHCSALGVPKSVKMQLERVKSPKALGKQLTDLADKFPSEVVRTWKGHEKVHGYRFARQDE